MVERRVPACVALCASVLLAACAATPHTPHEPRAMSASLPLLAPAALGATKQVAQVLHGEYGDRTFTLRCVVNVQDNQLTVIGVTSMGLRAFTLKYDGANLSEERAPQLPDALQAERLLNDLQLAYWPLPALQHAWHVAGVTVSEPYAGTRRLTRDGTLLAEVHYDEDPWHGRVWLRRVDYSYSLFIESVPLDSGSQ